jgi:hypothetical protein
LCRTIPLWRHPNQMMAEMPESEFRDWMADYEREPWGEERADMRMARQTWATFQVKSKKKLKEPDFMFKFRNNQKPPTPEEYRMKAMRAYAANGGRIK